MNSLRRGSRILVAVVVLTAMAIAAVPGSAAATSPSPAAASSLFPGPQAQAAKKRCKKGFVKRKGKCRRKPSATAPTQPTQGYAIVGGYSNYQYSLATLQYWNGTSWIDSFSIGTGAGTFYSLRVPAGPLPYRYWVTAEVFWSQSFFPCAGCPPAQYNCRQTWADASRSVVAAPGAVYSDLNTTLRPWGQARCY